MTIRAGTHRLGPERGSLTVRTYREGVAAKAGHDLVIEVTRWEATLDADPGGGIDVRFSADPLSLEVREGHNGLKPLSVRDREDIRKNMKKKVLGSDPIGFSSTSSRADGNGGLSVTGELTVAGSTRPVTLAVETAPDGHISGTVPMTQSEWGIEPYSGLMGALKVRDTIEIVIDARLPGA